MYSKRFLKVMTVVVTIGMLAGLFGVPISASEGSPFDAEPYMASQDDLLYSEDFDGKTELGEVNGTLAQEGAGGGTLTLEDGRLVLERTSTASNHDGFILNFGADYVGENIAVEFEMQREKSTPMVVLTRSGGTQAMQMQVINRLGGQQRNLMLWNGSVSTDVVDVIENFDTLEPFKVTVLHNTTARTYSVWVDGVKVAENFGFRGSVSNINNLRVYLEAAVTNKVYIDNIKVYKATTPWPGYDVVTGAAEGTPVYADFALPAAWPIGSENTLTWTSDSPELVIDGNMARVTAIYEDRQTNVVLTATTVRDGGTVSADYNVKIGFDLKPFCASEDDVLYFEDFEGKTEISEVNGSLVQNGVGGGTLKIEDGRLALTRTSTESNHDGFNLYFEGSGFAGYSDDNVVLEFDMAREGLSNMILTTRNAQSMHMNVGGNGQNIRMLGLTSGTVTQKTGWDDLGPFKFTILYNFTEQTSSVWINDELIAYKFDFRNASIPSFKELYVYLESSAQNTLYFDNFKVYNATLKMGDIVEAEYKALEESGFAAFSHNEQTAVTENLFIPEGYESNITFSSKNGLVSADGTVNLQRKSASDVVTVTISQGEHVRTLEYDITIPSAIAIEGIEFTSPIPIAGQNYATLNIYSRNSETYEVAFLVAAYEGNRLLDVSAVTYTVKPLGDGDNALVTNVEIEEATGDTKIKAFLLDSFQTMRPLEEVKENSQ